MEKDIQEIKISIARIETTQEHLCKKMDDVKGSIPVCEKHVIKEKVKMNRALIWWVFILFFGGVMGVIIKEAMAHLLN